MKTTTLLLILSIAVINCTYAQNKAKDTIPVFYLGGQSNMDGYGYSRDLPDSLKSDYNNIYIFHGNIAGDNATEGGIGIWDEMKPGHGRGFSSDGEENKLSDRFGVELSFAKEMKKHFPEKTIAIIKYSKGGTSIDSSAAGKFGCWEPDFNGVNQYDHFLTTVNNAFAHSDINKNGIPDYFVPYGIVWMQGESDAGNSEEIALRYYDNLKRLMDLIRAAFRTDDLPVVIGKISDSWNDEDGKRWDYCELVQYAQEKFARTDANAAIVRSTRYYKYSDPYHYTGEGFIDFGKQFALKLIPLLPSESK